MTTILRKITATYIRSSEFYLPSWLKEEDIAEKWVKHDELHVETKDGKHYIIPPYFSACECTDYKYPDGELVEEDEEVDEEEMEDIITSSPDDYIHEED